MSRKSQHIGMRTSTIPRDEEPHSHAWFIIPMSILLLLWILGYAFPYSRTWGFHHAAFLPLWADLILLLLAVLGLTPRFLSAIGIACLALEIRIDAAKPGIRRLLYAAAIVVAAGAFTYLAMPYSFLGDSFFMIAEIYRDVITGESKYFFGHSILAYPLYVWFASWIVKEFAVSEIQKVFILYGAIFGAAYVATVIAGVRRVVRDPSARLLLVILLFGLGGTLFFFGYVEHYTGYFTCTAAFMLALYAAVNRGSSFVWPVLLGALCIAFHYAAIACLPGLILAYIYRKYGSEHRERIARLTILSWPIGVFMASALYAIVRTYEISPIFAVLIPFFPTVAPYTLLSSYHLLDSINEILLVSGVSIPLALGALRELRGRSPFSDPGVQVFTTIALCLVLLMFFSSPFFGLARDWDIHAVIGIALTMTTFALFHSGPVRGLIRPVVIGAAVVWTTIGSVAWIGLNIVEKSAHARYRTLVAQDEHVLYPDHAQVGYENLRKYYSIKKQPIEEAAVLRHMIELRGYPWDFEKFQQVARANPSEPSIRDDVSAVLGLLIRKSDDSLMHSIVQGQSEVDSTEYVGDQWVRLHRDSPPTVRDDADIRDFVERHPELPHGYVAEQIMHARGRSSMETLTEFQALWEQFHTQRRGQRPVLSAFLARQILEPIANGYMLSQRYDSALVWLQRVTEIDSANPAVYNSIGQAKMQLGDFSGSEQNFLHAIALDETYTRSYYNIAYLYYVFNVKSKEALAIVDMYDSRAADGTAREQTGRLRRALERRLLTSRIDSAR